MDLWNNTVISSSIVLLSTDTTEVGFEVSQELAIRFIMRFEAITALTLSQSFESTSYGIRSEQNSINCRLLSHFTVNIPV